MSRRYEWHHAAATTFAVLPPHHDVYSGLAANEYTSDEHNTDDLWAVLFEADESTVLHGTVEELRDLLTRALAGLPEPPSTVTVQIENTYSDGHRSTHTAKVPAPTGTVIQWWEEVVYSETGDGHGAGADLGSCYTATVIAADDPALVGQTYEWSD